eukprot:1145349-Pelagomonas_calceolata.AAC.13
MCALPVPTITGETFKVSIAHPYTIVMCPACSVGNFLKEQLKPLVQPLLQASYMWTVMHYSGAQATQHLAVDMALQWTWPCNNRSHRITYQCLISLLLLIRRCTTHLSTVSI